MVKAIDLMQEDVVTIDSGATIKEAVELMKGNNIGNLVITEDEWPVGIITEWDVMVKVMAGDLQPAETKVEDIMTRELITVDVNTDLDNIVNAMQKHNFRRLPVLDNGKLVGIITIKDILARTHIEKGIIKNLAKAELW